MATNPEALKECYAFMDRILDLAAHEFPELPPIEIIFALGMLQWRYQEQIELIWRTRQAGGNVPEPETAPVTKPTDVN